MDKQFFRFFSEIAVFQESLVFTKAWLSRKPGCHESLVVTKAWLSRKPGYHESLVITKAWLSRKPGYHESLVITKPGYRKVGCHKAWLSESLVVWLLVVAVLFVTVLVVCLSKSVPRTGIKLEGYTILPATPWSRKSRSLLGSY